jgi:transcriptional regulator with XRE-family HTH domain
MPGTSDQWAAVGAAIRERMAELVPPMSQADLVRASGVSDPTVRDLMRGAAGSRRGETLWKVSIALGWERDRIHRIVAGDDEPAPAGPATTSEASPLARMAAEVEELRRTIAILESRLAALEQADPPPSPATDPPARAARSPRRR